jgi:hypothetical protein
VHEQRQPVLGVHDQVLPPPPHGHERAPRQCVQRGIEGLQRVDAGRDRRLDANARHGGADPPRRDLDLW